MTSTLEPPRDRRRRAAGRRRPPARHLRRRPHPPRRVPQGRSSRALDRLLVEGEDDLLAALRHDLGKPAVEGHLTDLAFVRAEIADTLRHLDAWTEAAAGEGAGQAAAGAGPRPPRPARHRADHRPVELPGAARARAARRRDRGRQHRGDQAERGRRPTRRARSPASSRRYLDRDAYAVGGGRCPRDDGAARRALGPHLLHGQRDGRARRDGRRGAAPHAGDARARRQEPGDRRRERRPRRRGPSASCGASTSTPARRASRPTTCSSTVAWRRRCSPA